MLRSHEIIITNTDIKCFVFDNWMLILHFHHDDWRQKDFRNQTSTSQTLGPSFTERHNLSPPPVTLSLLPLRHFLLSFESRCNLSIESYAMTDASLPLSWKDFIQNKRRNTRSPGLRRYDWVFPPFFIFFWDSHWFLFTRFISKEEQRYNYCSSSKSENSNNRVFLLSETVACVKTFLMHSYNLKLYVWLCLTPPFCTFESVIASNIVSINTFLAALFSYTHSSLESAARWKTNTLNYSWVLSSSSLFLFAPNCHATFNYPDSEETQRGLTLAGQSFCHLRSKHLWVSLFSLLADYSLRFADTWRARRGEFTERDCSFSYPLSLSPVYPQRGKHLRFSGCYSCSLVGIRGVLNISLQLSNQGGKF